MVAAVVRETNDLREACFDLARTTKWEQRPIDLDEINEHAERLYQIAQEQICESLDRDLALVARAVRYLTNAHGMPIGNDTNWFSKMLEAVLEVARPNTRQDGIGREFLKDMQEGIQSLLAN